jgi:acetyl esterase/lipase
MLGQDMIDFIAETARHYPDDAVDRTIVEQRAIYDRMAAAFTPPRPRGVTIEEGVLTLADRSIKLRAYRGPTGGRAGTAIYFHGGGFIVGGLDSHDIVTARLAASTNMTLLVVDYRLAPEHPYPAAHQDCYAVIKAVVEGSLLMECPNQKIILMGDSAGGNIAASAALWLKDQGLRQADGMVLFYPGLAPDPTPPARDEEANAPMLTLAEVRYYKRVYLGDHVPDRLSSPLLAADLSGLPKSLLLPVEHDPLRDDATLFARRLSDAGVEAELHIGAGLVHGCLRAISRSEGADFMLQKAASFLQIATGETL